MSLHVWFSLACGQMHLIGSIHLKTTLLYQKRELMWSSHQVMSGPHSKQIFLSLPSSSTPIFIYYYCCITGTWVVIDSSTPPLNKLTIVGVLEIAEMTNSSSGRQTRAAPELSPLVIEAVYISIQVSQRERQTPRIYNFPLLLYYYCISRENQ